MVRAWRVLLLLAPLAFTGCVDRLISVRSDPGAVVYVDGVRVGVTSSAGTLDIPYTYYGTRELLLTREGHRSHRQNVELAAPWWQIFPFDFISDVLLPVTLTDRIEVVVTLEKETHGSEDLRETRRRAAEAREKAIPPPAIPPPADSPK
jgi:hypothetical protein